MHALGGLIDKRIHSMKHTAEQYISEHSLENYFKFGFKRNPYHRFASLYTYFSTMGVDHPFYKYNQNIVKVVSAYNSFDHFAADFWKLKLRQNFHFRPQSDFLLKESGKPIVDFLGSVENIDQDLMYLKELISNTKTERVAAPVKNKSSDNRLHTLSTEIIEVVNNFYSRDLAMLGYPRLQ